MGTNSTVTLVHAMFERHVNQDRPITSSNLRYLGAELIHPWNVAAVQSLNCHNDLTSKIRTPIPESAGPVS